MRDILKRQLKRQLEEQFGQPPGSDQPTAANAFEVRCYGCDVSFPVGTKRCLHCGERLGRRALFMSEIVETPQGNLPRLDDSAEPQWEALPEGETSEEEAEQDRGSIFRLFGNLSWILLFAALTLYRACTG